MLRRVLSSHVSNVVLHSHMDMITDIIVHQQQQQDVNIEDLNQKELHEIDCELEILFCNNRDGLLNVLSLFFKN
jgi:hypothetical protein